ncbi:hypothetical protein FMUND_6890 [Fusarium mundagurra]|uniref:Uncharacterized protein n=1 Tax=Fusarium mundagurra TaxID=1567541 RepID=A0A8H6DF38_9HYPO|nr:hypothetical protein FMUND_6890 [Fusarium mundagurra]
MDSEDEDQIMRGLLGDKAIKKLEKKEATKKLKKKEGGTYWDKRPVKIRKIVNKSGWNSNGCCPLDNTPMAYQRQKFEYATLADGATLKYDCFMPTGETYEFLPCAPWRLEAKKVLGYQRFRGTHRIVEMEGAPVQGQDAFMPYKLLLYKGRDNEDPGYDDRHRFVYLAENKPGEPAVGDCFVRLEEIHERMKGEATDYIDDCAMYNEREEVLHALTTAKDKAKKEEALEDCKRLQRQGKWGLRFRCWTVEGNECAESENRLRNRLFTNVYPANDKWDHFDVFRVWAELLRKSQGDKLGAKDFFGRYWDAVIPDDCLHAFEDGFRIIIGAEWFQWFTGNVGGIQWVYQNSDHRLAAKEAVFEGIKHAINAPRLKFKPPLSVNNIVFQDEWDEQLKIFAPGWFDYGWRNLDAHPGGLYQIVVGLPVREFLTLDTHKRPFWQEGYGYPEEPDARRLNYEHLGKCHRPSVPTTTVVNTTYLNNPIKRRDPTQDRCVAQDGYSANLNGGNGTENAVIVETAIDYSALEQTGSWMGDKDHEYTWLAANLKYQYYSAFHNQNGNTWTKGHFYVTHNFFPFNRESCLLFQSILDKSLEHLYWGWNWDADRVVIDALLESTVVDGDKEEANKEELKVKLEQATDGDPEGALNAQALELVVQQNLAPEWP